MEENQTEDIIAALAHEVRAPIVLMRALLESQIQSIDPEVYSKLDHTAVGMLQMSSSIMKALNNQPIQVKPVNAARITKEIRSKMHKILEIRQQKVVVSGSIRSVVLAEEVLLEQIITNLLDNASKYSPPNTTITISFKTLDNSVQIRIRDYGIGVSPQELMTATSRFGKIKQPIAAHSGSNGFGLYLCELLAKKMSAQLHVSQVKDGSCFWISIPTTEQAVLPLHFS